MTRGSIIRAQRKAERMQKAKETATTICGALCIFGTMALMVFLPALIEAL